MFFEIENVLICPLQEAKESKSATVKTKTPKKEEVSQIFYLNFKYFYLDSFQNSSFLFRKSKNSINFLRNPHIFVLWIRLDWKGPDSIGPSPENDMWCTHKKKLLFNKGRLYHQGFEYYCEQKFKGYANCWLFR